MFVLILCILLIITASLALNTYSRLNNASKKYPSADGCNVSKTYVTGSAILMIMVLIFAFCLAIYEAVKI
jgi:hypothetical protein